jgi:hypothetical protein
MAFLVVIFAGEAISLLTGNGTHFNFETIHFQIALLGAILQESLHLLKP